MQYFNGGSPVAPVLNAVLQCWVHGGTSTECSASMVGPWWHQYCMQIFNAGSLVAPALHAVVNGFKQNYQPVSSLLND
jgi:hypothetical protein